MKQNNEELSLRKNNSLEQKGKKLPEYALNYWNALVAIMPEEFNNKGFTQLGAIEIFFRNPKGKETGYIYRNCTSKDHIDGGEVREVSDEIKATPTTGWESDSWAEDKLPTHQFKFKFDVDMKNVLDYKEFTTNDTFLSEFVENVKKLSTVEGSTIWIPKYMHFYSDGTRWVKGRPPKPKSLDQGAKGLEKGSLELPEHEE